MTDLNKEFAKLAGISFVADNTFVANYPCPRCNQRVWQTGNLCNLCGCDLNQDYSSDPLAVLLVMRKRVDWDDFFFSLSGARVFTETMDDEGNVYGDDCIAIKYLLTPGAMVSAAVDYLTNVQANDGKS